MRKEVGIGLAVIAILLTVFGFVLFNRVIGPQGEPSALAADTGQTPPTTSAASDEKDASRNLSGGPTLPAIIPAQAGPDDWSKNAKASYDDWSVPSGDKNTTAKAEQANIEYSPPSFMPKLEATTTAQQTAGYAAVDRPKSTFASPRNSTPTRPSGSSTTEISVQKPPKPIATSVGPFTSGALLDSVRHTDRPDTAQSGAYATDQPSHHHQHDPAAGSALPPPPYPGGGAYQYDDSGRYSQNNVGQSQTPGYDTGSYSGYGNYPTQSQPYSQTPQPYSQTGQPYPQTPQQLGAYDTSNQGYGPADPRKYDTKTALSKDGTYTVQPNDNYWRISENLYGTGAFFRALAEHNRKQFPDGDQLEVGSKISAPGIAILEKHYPDLCPKPEHRDVAKRHMSMVSTSRRLGGTRVYVVQEGDTLFDIARFELGKASRWAEVFELNQNVLGDQYNYLTPGMQLLLPEDHSGDTVTQRDDTLYHR